MQKVFQGKLNVINGSKKLYSNLPAVLYNNSEEKRNGDIEFPFTPDIIRNRRNTLDDYIIFASNFISVVVGKRQFDNYSWRFNFSNYVSVSDEAFALLIFINYYER